MLLLEWECPVCGFSELQAIEGDGTKCVDSYVFGEIECFQCGRVFSKYPVHNENNELGIELIEIERPERL
jgi:uncharacterized Zn finger protein